MASEEDAKGFCGMELLVPTLVNGKLVVLCQIATKLFVGNELQYLGQASKMDLLLPTTSWSWHPVIREVLKISVIMGKMCGRQVLITVMWTLSCPGDLVEGMLVMISLTLSDETC